MKNVILFSVLSFALFSCNKKETGEKSDGNLIENNSAKVQLSGEVLIQNSDCVGCHNKDEKMVGPSYKEIASKYPTNDKNIDMLAYKIINGGSGNWGRVPMQAHVGLSKEDAKEMVKYILAQK
ncbi:c-type cytochrome [Halpernia frigidisoli]|uniref:Cytochrome c n=1 Tax=Halpernia frigidisoli TaxID=1125876 RepID=A0A1I3IZX1_9FLAO|nr:c-type cytochrome [Halpernia frigidisoli]SFI53423.1 cytochrome c [Halpernia frigidisoli]